MHSLVEVVVVSVVIATIGALMAVVGYVVIERVIRDTR